MKIPTLFESLVLFFLILQFIKDGAYWFAAFFGCAWFVSLSLVTAPVMDFPDENQNSK